MQETDWNQAKGVPCSCCGVELFKVNWRNNKPYCQKHFVLRDGIWVEECTCYKCGVPAARRIEVSKGLETVKITCRHCGTYFPPKEKVSPEKKSKKRRPRRKSRYREIEDRLKEEGGY